MADSSATNGAPAGPAQPLFIDVRAGPFGRRFALHHAPHDASPCGLVVHVHAFGEEMNKSRRMTALQSRALANAGFAVLRVDLLGCGDSEGEFGDATWTRWVDDVAAACRWLRGRHGDGSGQPLPLWLWGQRAGALLAVQAATRLAEPCHFLFWQPAVAGKALLQQFLRLKAAADLSGGQAKQVLAGLRDELAAGRVVDVAGYRLGAALARGLDEARLQPPNGPSPTAGRVEWFEVVPRAAGGAGVLSPAAQSQSGLWRQAGWSVRGHVVGGPAFWQTSEIEDAPALIGATVAALLQAPAPTAAADALPLPGAFEAVGA